METTHAFRLNFLTSQSAVKTINVPRANATATPQRIADAMQAVIDSGVVQSVRGTPIENHSAELVTTTRRAYDVL